MSDDIDIRMTLTGGDELTLPAVGNYYRIISANSPLKVALNDGPLVTRYQGMGQGRKGGFSILRLLSDTTQDVHIAVSDGQVDDSRLTLTADVNVSKSNTLDSVQDVSLAAGATTLIAAADSARREILITNLAANAQTFRVGDSGAGAANGVPLEPGQTLALETAAAVFGYNPGASAESVAVAVLKD